MAHVSTVTIAASQVPADQTDFPVLLPTPPTDSAIWSDTTPSGGDIRIFASDGTTEWAREIVSFDATAKTCEIWVKVPFLSSSSDTAVQIHADGASSDYAVTALYGRNNVWSDYDGVFHISDGLSTTLTDSSGNQNATSSSAVGSVSGKVGLAADTNDANQIAFISGHKATDGDAIYAWMNIDTYASASSLPSVGSFDENRRFYAGQFATGGRWVAGYGTAFIDIAAATLNTWGLIATYKIGGTAYGKLNNNAALSASSTFSVASTIDTAVTGRNDSGTRQPVVGRIDEVRIRKASSNWPSAATAGAWLDTEYNNQSAPNTFATWADEAAGDVPVLGAITATATTSNSISFSVPVSY